MKKTNLAITGCMGRMGQQIIKSVKKDKRFKLVTLTENKIINKKISGIKPNLNNVMAFKNTNIIFNRPDLYEQYMTNGKNIFNFHRLTYYLYHTNNFLSIKYLI